MLFCRKPRSDILEESIDKKGGRKISTQLNPRGPGKTTKLSSFERKNVNLRAT